MISHMERIVAALASAEGDELSMVQKAKNEISPARSALNPALEGREASAVSAARWELAVVCSRWDLLPCGIWARMLYVSSLQSHLDPRWRLFTSSSTADFVTSASPHPLFITPSTVHHPHHTIRLPFPSVHVGASLTSLFSVVWH